MYVSALFKRAQIAARVFDASALIEDVGNSAHRNKNDCDWQLNHDAPVPEGHGTLSNGGASFSR